MAKISIIVPIYKVEPYLCRCIDSILNQTFTDFECILVDDGSPDNCPRICDEYAKKDKRIKVIHKPNGGLSDARNAGLDIAQGEYIGFVDSDDWIHPQMYEILYNINKRYNTDIAVCSYVRKTKFQYEDIELYIKKEELSVNIYNSQYLIDNFYYDTINVLNPTVWSKLYHRSIWSDLRFKKDVIHEDEFVLLPSIMRAKSVAILDANLYYYFTNTAGIMHAPFNCKNYVVLDCMLDRCELLCDNWTQYKRAKKVYYDYYIIFYIVTMLHRKEYKYIFKKYKKIYYKEILFILRNNEICNRMKLVIFMLHIAPRISVKLCEKYFEHIIQTVNKYIG